MKRGNTTTLPYLLICNITALSMGGKTTGICSMGALLGVPWHVLPQKYSKTDFRKTCWSIFRKRSPRRRKCKKFKKAGGFTPHRYVNH